MSHKQSVPSAPVKRVYLDLCALNRPLDDQGQIRVRLEADAVSLILSHVRAHDDWARGIASAFGSKQQRIRMRPNVLTFSFCWLKWVLIWK